MIAAQEIVLERLTEQIEIFMEKRLWRDMEGKYGMRFIGSVTIDNTPKLQNVFLKLQRRTEHALAVHVALYLGLLHLGRVFETLSKCLR